MVGVIYYLEKKHKHGKGAHAQQFHSLYFDKKKISPMHLIF